VNTVLRFHQNLKLLHCSIRYPTALDECNLGVMETLRKAFPGIEVGYSDHTSEISEAPVQSVLLGGTVVEKHITLDRRMDGPDHFFALEPPELERMVKDIRAVEERHSRGDMDIDPVVYGSSAKVCHEHEKYMRDFCYPTLFAGREISKGEPIKPRDISILRPGKKKRGLDPKYLALFERYEIAAKTDISPEDPILWETIL